jgi:hypothetical protein
LLPWKGSRVVRTLSLRLAERESTRASDEGFYLALAGTAAGPEATLAALREIADTRWNATDIAERVAPAFLKQKKYDEFLPMRLLQRAFATSSIDVSGAHDSMLAMLAHVRLTA